MAERQKNSALLLAGTHSGCGKTTVSLGLMAALAERGCRVRPFKCGPDFIDPSLHRLVTGRISRNLDPWMTGEEFTRQTFARHCHTGDLGLIEGVMGMFDGGASSSAALARLLEVPVVLILDVKAAAESVAAVLKGFETFSPETAPAAVILNRVGSERHLELLRRAIGEHCRTEIIGWLPRDLRFSIPERHLGLHMGEEAPISTADLANLAAKIREGVDLNRLLAIAATGNRSWAAAGEATMAAKPRTALIGVARDEAFCFYYQDNLDLLRQVGAELVFFSPLRDRQLPPGISGLYLGGGYPELHAADLAANRAMCVAIREWAEAGGVIYGECGGFIYLSKGIEDRDGVFHPLAGVFPARARMGRKLAALGYREITLKANAFFGAAGTRLRGHEFHYSKMEPMADNIERFYESKTSSGTASSHGYRYRQTVAGYTHLHFGSNPEAARALVEACRRTEAREQKTEEPG